MLRLFCVWAKEREVTTIEQLTPELFEAYQEELTFRINPRGRPISISTQRLHLGVIRRWGRYLGEQDFLISNPAKRLQLPRKPHALPRAIPDMEEATRLVEARRGDDREAYRDQTILELLYSTGLRRGEVSNLNVSDVDLVGGYCWVREGKGKKDRVVPLGKMACKRLEIYLDAVRPSYLKGREQGALFLHRRGGRLSGQGIHGVVRRAVIHARLSRKITPHALRHAAATHMMKNGAPIRHLQEFLGHASLETTQVYTRITIPELKAIHAKYHPREVAAATADMPPPLPDGRRKTMM
jgi:integrase/recombinase XerD